MISIIFNLCIFFAFIIIYIKNSLCNHTFSNNILIHRQLKISNYPGIFVVCYFQECDTPIKPFNTSFIPLVVQVTRHLLSTKMIRVQNSAL